VFRLRRHGRVPVYSYRMGKCLLPVFLLIYIGSYDNSINIFDMKGERLRHLRLFNQGINCIIFPDEKTCLAGTQEGLIQKISL
jgi:hypothetical protein